MFRVTVNVRYLQSVINPEEEVLNGTVKAMGLDAITSVKLGRTYTFNVEAESKEEAENIIKELADKLLVNKAMETYSMNSEEA
ncbi:MULTISPECIES: phosphoribosylformylglycinamidine synthase subunit PurS [unclassified Jeotgalibaca]|uniref:phosphoribosylformylglycinamidine synthase subunit PurS n=1 Tax=unclassified Jeotgalibaca TaxID=2621505 RepID=UPI003FD11D75